MMKLYQFSWLGINFSELNIKKYSNRQADKNFYYLFYKFLFKKYQNLDKLPKPWLKHKINIAKFLHKISIKKIKKKNINLLSIGCGLGLIENYLSQKNLVITATECQSISTRFLKKEINFLETKKLTQFKNKYYDIIFASGIDYVFTNNEYQKFLINLKKIDCKYVIFTDIIIMSKLEIYISYLKSIIKYKYFGQFWGWIRPVNEHLNIFKESGFKIIKFKKMINSENFYAILQK